MISIGNRPRLINLRRSVSSVLNPSASLPFDLEGAISAAAPTSPAQGKLVATKSPWLINPLVDLLFCCGGFVWICFAVCSIGHFADPKNAVAPFLGLLTLIGSHAFSEPHTAATLVRVYRTDKSVEMYKPWTVYAALACGAFFLAGLYIPQVTPWLAKIYLLCVVQHFTAQTFGFALLYCYRGGYRLSKLEKFSLSLLMNATAAFAIIRQLTFYEWSGNGFLAQRLPTLPTPPLAVFNAATTILTISAVFFVAQVCKRAFKSGEMLPVSACLTIFTGVLIYTVGFSANLLLTLFVPAFFHASQYLLLSAHYHLRDSNTSSIILEKNLDLPQKAFPLRYYGQLLLVSLFLYVAIPRLLQELGFNYSLAFATTFAAVNLHHFLTDGGIWKLRNNKVRAAVMAS